jgi:hypothetical protein
VCIISTEEPEIPLAVDPADRAGGGLFGLDTPPSAGFQGGDAQVFDSMVAGDFWSTLCISLQDRW